MLLSRMRVAALAGVLLLANPAAGGETFGSRKPLVCPKESKLTILDGPKNKAEFCTVGKILHGPAREWYPNGEQRTSDNWSHGKQIGLWIEWDEKGVKRQEHCYREGKLDGRETIWYANGQRQSITHYSNGQKDGPIAQWSEDGLQLASGQFLKDKAEGKWTFRDPDTRETWYVMYVHGEAVEKTHIRDDEFNPWVESPARCDGAV